ncbi:MAG: type II secretion system minor pseudopilin GspK [Luminiphilus sp.]|nr:type II secretion system minor pseudopilin GspK [Luminiphilus sp.]
MCCPPFKAQQGGAALIVALLVFALASALIVGLQREFALQLQRGTNSFVAEQGWAYLRGAESLGVVALQLDAGSDASQDKPVDDLTELWAEKAKPFPLIEGGWLLGSLEDLQGRFNLNGLVDSGASNGANTDANTDAMGDPSPLDREAGGGGSNELSGETQFNSLQRQFIRLLGALENVQIDRQQAIGIMQSVVDFIDSDTRRLVNGAEDGAYQRLIPPYRTAGQPLASVSELRSVAGVTPEIYRALAPFVTVWPKEGGTLNILTASATVLRSLPVNDLLEPMSKEEGLRLVEARAAGVIFSVETLLEDVLFSGAEGGELTALLGERSDWFLLSASVEIAERELHLYSVLERDRESVFARYRSQGEL